jgi:hypothetical protein
MDAEQIEQRAAQVILDRGVRYKLGEGDITIRPLRFGTLLLLSGRVAKSGLTEEKIKEGEGNTFVFFKEYAELMLECVAIAELNDRDKLTDEGIRERAAFYEANLNAFQVYELFLHVLALSGIQDFTNTIRLILRLSWMNLSPRIQGS